MTDDEAITLAAMTGLKPFHESGLDLWYHRSNNVSPDDTPEDKEFDAYCGRHSITGYVGVSSAARLAHLWCAFQRLTL